MLGGEEQERGWVGGRERGQGSDQGSRYGFIIRPDMDSPAVTGTALDGREWGDELVWEKAELEGDCRGFVKVIRYQRRCVVLWRESAAYGRWKSRIALSVRSALRLVRRAESGEQSRPGSPAAAGLWLGRWGRAAPAGCPSPSPACPPMCRCACPAPHCAPAALTPGHTSHSGSNEGEKVNVFGEVQEQEDREGRGGGPDKGGKDKMKNMSNFTT